MVSSFHLTRAARLLLAHQINGRVGRRVTDLNPRLATPSSNRTCRFPASGSPENLGHRLTQLDLQGFEPKSPEVLVIRTAFRETKSPLTAPVQVPEQALADVAVDLANR